MDKMSDPNVTVGRLRKQHSDFYYVALADDVYECKLRGLIKKEGTDVLVGDDVVLDSLDPANKTARIYEVLPRRNSILRPKMANVDQVIIVYSLREPDFDPAQMDRYLTHVELAGLHPVICLTKTDLLDSKQEILDIQRLYADQLGFELWCTSVHDVDGLRALQAQVTGKISVLAGLSGAGKSSLLNAFNPNLQLRVGEVSEKIARGQHTTRHVELVQLFDKDPATLIADTPGFSNLRFNYVLPRQIEAVFRDFAPYREQCAFSDCLHRDESDCAVQAHLAHIAPSRWASYQALLSEALEYKQEAQSTSQKQDYGYKAVSKKGQETLKVLRLKEKNRDASRRTQRQQVYELIEAEGTGWTDDQETLESDPPDSV